MGDAGDLPEPCFVGFGVVALNELPQQHPLPELHVDGGLVDAFPRIDFGSSQRREGRYGCGEGIDYFIGGFIPCPPHDGDGDHVPCVPGIGGVNVPTTLT